MYIYQRLAVKLVAAAREEAPVTSELPTEHSVALWRQR